MHALSVGVPFARNFDALRFDCGLLPVVAEEVPAVRGLVVKRVCMFVVGCVCQAGRGCRRLTRRGALHAEGKL